MESFRVGSVPEYDQREDPNCHSWMSYAFKRERPYGYPQSATVHIVTDGVKLDTIAAVFDPAKARELGYLLIKAAERHDDLVKQVALIEEQRKNLWETQESLIQELMK